MTQKKFRYTAIRENGHIFSTIFSLEQIEAGEVYFWFEVNHIGENTTVFREQYSGIKDTKGIEIYEGNIIYIAGYGNYEVEFPFLELYTTKK